PRTHARVDEVALRGHRRETLAVEVHGESRDLLEPAREIPGAARGRPVRPVDVRGLAYHDALDLPLPRGLRDDLRGLRVAFPRERAHRDDDRAGLVGDREAHAFFAEVDRQDPHPRSLESPPRKLEPGYNGRALLVGRAAHGCQSEQTLMNEVFVLSA